MTRFVYLAGPIFMCSEEEAKEWRTYVSERLPPNVIGISPLRCEPPINGRYDLVSDDVKFGTDSAISAKNWFDTSQCDLILAYLPAEYNARRPSYGTVIEIGWAIGLRKPIILVSDDDHLLGHPLVTTNVAWRIQSLDVAIEIIGGLFADYTRPTP